MKNLFTKRIIAILCISAVLLGSTLIPSMSLAAVNTGVDDSEFDKEDFFASTVYYNFEESEDPVASAATAADSVNMTRAGDGVGCNGWSFSVAKTGGNPDGVLRTRNTSATNTHGTSGGYRLNNSDGVFRLATSTTYIVEFDVNVTGAPIHREDYTDINEAIVKLGYGFSGTASNPVNRMSTTLSNVVSVYTDATTYTVTSSEGVATYDINSGWKRVKYVFTTPADFGGKDNSLGFFAATYPKGFECLIDNVSVKALDTNEGIIVLQDDYNNRNTIIIGAHGDEAELPELVSDNAEYRFEGWYTSANRLDSEKVSEPYLFTVGTTTLYARWYAPVSITLVNTLDGSQQVISGLPGESIVFPEAPADPNGEQWFMGWYTTSEATEKFEGTAYGYSNVTLYSYWKPTAKGGIVDFENYTKDAYSVETDANGNKYKTNRYYFFTTLSKDSTVTYNNSNYSLKFNWDAEMVKDANNENSYDAAGRYKNVDNVAIMEGVALDNKTTYVVKFKYYVEKADGSVRVSPFSASAKSIWSSNRVYYRTQNAGTFITSSDADGNWHEGMFSFTTDFNGSGTSMYILLNMDENKDAVIYLDDIEFIPVQPDESMITYNGGAGVKTHIAIGKKGAQIPQYIPSDGKREFLGWYTDTTYSTAFDSKVFPEEPVTIYAKWSVLPLTFEDYEFSTEAGLNFGKTMAVVSEKGVGINDNYALRFDYDGSDLYKTNDDGTQQLMNKRYNMPDHAATVKQNLSDDTVYIITYYVKTESANSDYTVRFLTAATNSIWNAKTSYDPAYISRTTETAGDGWTKVTTAIKTDFSAARGHTLYIYFNVDSKATTAKVKALVDNITVEQVYAPAAVFNKMNGEGAVVLTGNAGDTIKYPASPAKFAKDFSGWYSDAQLTAVFGEKTFKEKEVFFAYAGYADSKTVVYDFEHYLIGTTEETGYIQRLTADPVSKSFAYSGNTVIEINRGREDQNTAGSGYIVAQGAATERLDKERYYIIKFKYYVEKHGERALQVNARTSSETSFWGNALLSNNYVIDRSDEEGKWHTGTLVVNGSKIKSDSRNHLYMWHSQGDYGVYYFDDIEITELDEGIMAYFIDNGNCSDVPEYVTGKMGESFASQLPKNPKYNNHQFLGYFFLGDDGKYQPFTNMVFTEEEPKIEARFIRIVTTQDFENNFQSALDRFASYSQIDFDYELYDALAQGNSRDNVTSGRYSLRRKGDTHFFENAQVLTETTQLVAGERYTVTFKVKMGKYLQTDGAVKIVSNNSARFAWSTMGDYYPTVAIADLTDGKWHTVSYTFNAVENYVSFQTPGYCELFFDDIVFTRVDENTPLSTPVEYTEYVPAKRDLTTGEILEEVMDASTIDISTIIDPNMGKGIGGIISLITNGGYMWIIIAAAILVAVIAAVVLLIVILKKKKQKKA